MSSYPIRIVRAENDLLFDQDGRSYVDLFTAHGTAFLGHANPAIGAEVAAQLGQVWATGGLDTPVAARGKTLVESFFPPSYGLAALYSTGMEAAEFALRMARAVTGRRGVVGFDRNMHGKSLATSRLGWDHRGQGPLPDLERLPFLPDCSEAEAVRNLEAALAARPVAAVFVEPIQGCGGGRGGSAGFLRNVHALCRDAGALLVFDEILTGFFRTGPPFVFSGLPFVPDIVLIGKAMGNGFPVAGVVADRRFPVRKEMLPGSTFAGNPLAWSAVHATLAQMRSLDMAALTGRIEAIVREELGGLSDEGVGLRGRGALWVLELPEGRDAEPIGVSLYRSGVAVGFAGRLLRLLPPATIDPDRLRGACATLREHLLRANHE